MCLREKQPRLPQLRSAAGSRRPSAVASRCAGSTSSARPRPADFAQGGSDLDFLVEFEPADAGHADRYFGLLECLEQLFGRPVDLGVASAVKNPYVLESIERTKVLLYAS